ncbi:hypothetical protein [Microterricola gilva]|uniref:hypothetical protein n=1 Tax=Microterricola gilva TaxID=393267 RepID=UPI0013EED598|nr:hypothetical protein [Microterricola gilva]
MNASGDGWTERAQTRSTDARLAVRRQLANAERAIGMSFSRADTMSSPAVAAALDLKHG